MAHENATLAENMEGLLTGNEKHKARSNLTCSDDTCSVFVDMRGHQTWLPTAKALLILLLHTAGIVTVALSMALGLNGYRALDDGSAKHARMVDGRLMLRVADVTTLVSTMLVVTRLLATVWTTRIVWAYTYELYQTKSKEGNGETDETGQDFAIKAHDAAHMRRWKLPAWLVLPPKASKMPRNGREWIMSVALLLGAMQGLTSPLVTGAVNWTSEMVAAGAGTGMSDIIVSVVDQRADFSNWYWYVGYSHSRSDLLRVASGFVSLAWGDHSNVAADGSSQTGNGCRHIMADSNDGVGLNATLFDAVLPCIQIHGIDYYESTDTVNTSSPSLSMVQDDPASYFDPGVAVLYDTDNPWADNQDTDTKPAVLLHAATPLSFWMLVKRVRVNNRTEPCADIDPTIYGDVDAINARGRYVLDWGNSYDTNCYWYGRINLTAGVTRSPQSRYLSSRVVEDQTPIGDVVFEGDPWVQEALWLLPDLMTMSSITNATMLPTYDNPDGYLRALVSRSYLAAWDALHHSFDQDQQNQTYRVRPSVSRQIADISRTRVFSWLACGLLMTASGALLLLTMENKNHLALPGDEWRDQMNEQIAGADKDIINECTLS